MTLSSIWKEQTFVFTPGKESSSLHSEGELYIPAVELDVLQTSKHLLTSKREKQNHQLLLPIALRRVHKPRAVVVVWLEGVAPGWQQITIFVVLEVFQE